VERKQVVKVAALLNPILVQIFLKFALGNSTRGLNIHTELLHFIFNSGILLAFRTGSKHRLHCAALSSKQMKAGYVSSGMAKCCVNEAQCLQLQAFCNYYGAFTQPCLIISKDERFKDCCTGLNFLPQKRT
jgi:hypothetical protein